MDLASERPQNLQDRNMSFCRGQSATSVRTLLCIYMLPVCSSSLATPEECLDVLLTQ